MSIEKAKIQESLVFSNELGMIMIKPHSLRQGFDAVILDTLYGNTSRLFLQGRQEEFVQKVNKIKVVGQYYRNLETLSYGPDLIDMLYTNKRHEKYYPLMKDAYLGESLFVLFQYYGTQKELQLFLKELKGEQSKYDGMGQSISEGAGIRGRLSTRFRYFNRAERPELSESEYAEAFKPIISNHIHTCDSPEEVAIILKTIASTGDIDDLKRRGIDIIEYIKQYSL